MLTGFLYPSAAVVFISLDIVGGSCLCDLGGCSKTFS